MLDSHTSGLRAVKNIWTNDTAGFQHVENMLFRETDGGSAMPTWQTHLLVLFSTRTGG